MNLVIFLALQLHRKQWLCQNAIKLYQVFKCNTNGKADIWYILEISVLVFGVFSPPVICPNSTNKKFEKGYKLPKD